MNVVDLARVVVEYKNAQGDYFRTRSDTAYHNYMRLIKKLDHCIAIILDGQQELFAKDSPPPSGPHDAV